MDLSTKIGKDKIFSKKNKPEKIKCRVLERE